MTVIKLPSGKHILREHGASLVVIPPRGVFYSPYHGAWRIRALVNDTWVIIQIPKSLGVVEGYYAACDAREERFGMLLNRRLLQHQVRPNKPIRHNDQGYCVYDPINAACLTTPDHDHAQALRDHISCTWKYLHRHADLEAV